MRLPYLEFKRIVGRIFGTEKKQKNADMRLIEALMPYVIGWQGIKGEFDRDKLFLFFKKFPNVADAFGMGLIEIFQAKDAERLKYQESAEKN
jgi:hypothetical protein